MHMHRLRMIAYPLAILLAASGSGAADPQTSASRIEAVLTNIQTLERPGEDGLATVWDGNKYVQCRRVAGKALRCEAAGTRMQPSLGHVLNAEHVVRLGALGWQLDPNFGNYAQTFAADRPLGVVADAILQALAEGYDADLANLEVRSDWIASEPCPPRNGPTQNLAGLISDAPTMKATAVHACAYRPASVPAHSAADVIDLYGTRVAGEIQRLRVNNSRSIFLILQAEIGYVQCAPETKPDAIYCEAQSADSWPVLARILTPDRVAILHAAGFADPGRAPNYWKNYPLDKFEDAAVANELLTVLYDVYGYDGVAKLEILTEKSDSVRR